MQVYVVDIEIEIVIQSPLKMGRYDHSVSMDEGLSWAVMGMICRPILLLGAEYYVTLL